MDGDDRSSVSSCCAGLIATIGNPVFRWMTLMINFDEVTENRNVALRALDAAAAAAAAHRK